MVYWGVGLTRLVATPADFWFGLRFRCAPVLMYRQYIPLRCSRKHTPSGAPKRRRQNAELGERVFSEDSNMRCLGCWFSEGREAGEIENHAAKMPRRLGGCWLAPVAASPFAPRVMATVPVCTISA